jgi:hypothetical protein
LESSGRLGRVQSWRDAGGGGLGDFVDRPQFAFWSM